MKTDNNIPKYNNDLIEVETLKCVINELTSQKIKYWVTDGTALKLYRDNTIFPSSDFDFAMFSYDIPKALIVCDNLKKLGYVVAYQNRLPFVEDYITMNPPKECTFGPITFNFYHIGKDEAFHRNFSHPFRKEKIWIKFFSLGFKLQEKPLDSNRTISRKIFSFIPYPVRNIVSKILFMIYEKYAKTYWYVVPLDFFTSLQKIKIYDLELLIPRDIENFLEYRYGTTWKTPIKYWNQFECQHVRIRPLKYARVKKYRVPHVVSSYNKFIDWDVFAFNDEEIEKILLRDKRL